LIFDIFQQNNFKRRIFVAILLGVDLGTSGVKVLAINESGESLASTNVSYPLIQPRAGWSEQNAADWWEGTTQAIQTILKDPAVPSDSVVALSLSGQMHGSVFLDSYNKVIRNPILWNDTRTFQECQNITDIIGEGNLLNFVGNPALEGFTLPKLLWLRENEPENYQNLATLMLPKDYIVYRLTGRLCTEYSDAAGTLLLDVKNRSWSKEVCEKLDVEISILPELLDSTAMAGTLTKQASKETGLPQNVKVIPGGADNAISAVGNGIVEEGIMLASIGTSGVVLAHTNDMHHDPQGRIHSFNHAVPNSWYLMGVMLSAGMSMSWLKNELIGRDYDYINDQAAQVEPGSEGVIFLPYLFGERTPHRDPKARGAYFGISGIHSQKHMMRAVFEGVAFGLKDSLELIKDLGVQPSQIRITGGGAKSALWRQILADVFNAEVMTMQADEGPAFGAALLAGVGAGVYSSVDEAVKNTVALGESYEPDSTNSARYEEIYPLFKSLYQSLKGDYQKAFDIFNND
jgi:xylulokinase